MYNWRTFTAVMIPFTFIPTVASASISSPSSDPYLYVIECPAEAAVTVVDDTAVQDIVEGTNALREAVGATDLSRSVELDALAQSWAECLAGMDEPFSEDKWPNEGFYHNLTPTQTEGFYGDMPEDGRISGGENIAYVWGSDESGSRFVQLWRESSGHYANMVNARFTTIGVGYARSATGGVYAVQVFGNYTTEHGEPSTSDPTDFSQLTIENVGLLAAGANDFTVSGLTPGEVYRIGVSAKDDDGLNPTTFVVATADDDGVITVAGVPTSVGAGTVTVTQVTSSASGVATAQFDVVATGADPTSGVFVVRGVTAVFDDETTDPTTDTGETDDPTTGTSGETPDPTTDTGEGDGTIMWSDVAMYPLAGGETIRPGSYSVSFSGLGSQEVYSLRVTQVSESDSDSFVVTARSGGDGNIAFTDVPLEAGHVELTVFNDTGSASFVVQVADEQDVTQEPSTPATQEPENTVVPIPETPDVADPCGADNASWYTPADTDSVFWSNLNGVLSAHTRDGYVFSTGETSSVFGIAPDSGAMCSTQATTPPTGDTTDAATGETPVVESTSSPAVDSTTDTATDPTVSQDEPDPTAEPATATDTDTQAEPRIPIPDDTVYVAPNAQLETEDPATTTSESQSENVVAADVTPATAENDTSVGLTMFAALGLAGILATGGLIIHHARAGRL